MIEIETAIVDGTAEYDETLVKFTSGLWQQACVVALGSVSAPQPVETGNGRYYGQDVVRLVASIYNSYAGHE